MIIAFCMGVLALPVFIFFGKQEGMMSLESRLTAVVLGDEDEEDEEDDEDEEDEEEDEDEDEDDDEDERSSSSTKKSAKTETVTKQVVTYETRMVNDPEFLIDTDGDGLVDGVDPEPNFDFREYFTDTDGDSVPNAFDKHHDEDDFSYHDEETDENNNGILDSYE